jgi:hypothetical protein
MILKVARFAAGAALIRPVETDLLAPETAFAVNQDLTGGAQDEGCDLAGGAGWRLVSHAVLSVDVGTANRQGVPFPFAAASWDAAKAQFGRASNHASR